MPEPKLLAPNYHDFTLDLQKIQDLFQVPELNPFAGQVQFDSGINQLIHQLKSQSLRRMLRTTIRLPPDQISPHLTHSTETALKHYCDAKIVDFNHEQAYLWRQGMTALQIGLIFLALCLFASTLFEELGHFPEFLRRFFREGFLIMGWVGLWYPTEVLLFEGWVHWRNKRLYERIREMVLVIEAQN